VPLIRESDGSKFDILEFLRNLNLDLPKIPLIGVTPLFGLASGTLFFIFLLIIVMALLFVLSLVISYKFRSEHEKEIVPEKEVPHDLKELIGRRETLGKRIEDIINLLQIAAREKTFSEGITLGFEELDQAMKEFSRISRPGWLTPREYAQLRIPYFNHKSLSEAVEIFYEITYGERKATITEFNSFLGHIESMIRDQSILRWESDQQLGSGGLL
jgi:hypothetical protein